MRADKKKVSRLVRTARGQLDGILKMIDEDRYCIDISNQLMAANAILKRANREVLAAHMQGCLIDAVKAGNEKEKIDEIMKLMEKMV